MRGLTGSLAVAAALALTACGGEEPTKKADEKPVFSAAFETCHERTERGIAGTDLADDLNLDEKFRLGDEGNSVTVTGFGGTQAAVLTNIMAVMCVAGETDAPDTLTSKIEQTRPVDGKQSETWGDVEMSWSYDAKTGLSAIFERAD